MRGWKLRSLKLRLLVVGKLRSLVVRGDPIVS